LKRKAHLKRLSTGMAKRLRLDPSAVQEDLTITMYYERTQALIPDDRKQLHVHIPFADEIERIQNKLQSLEARTERLEIIQKRKLKMLCGNALIELARLAAKKYKSELVGDASTTRLQQFAASVTDAQLRDLEVPPKFWTLLRNIEKIIEARNQQAHETAGEFAQLLLDKQFKEGHVFNLWKDIFPLVYGATVEEIAAREKETDDMVFGLV